MLTPQTVQAIRLAQEQAIAASIARVAKMQGAVAPLFDTAPENLEAAHNMIALHEALTHSERDTLNMMHGKVNSNTVLELANKKDPTVKSEWESQLSISHAPTPTDDDQKPPNP